MKKTLNKKQSKLGAAEPAKTQLSAKDYNSRSDLETAVGKLVALDTLPKNYELRGTRKELAKLHLSDRTVFYGIKCVITDDPTAVKSQAERPERGKKHNFGINIIQ